MRKLKNKRIKGQTIVDSQEMMFNIAMLSTMQNSLHKDRIRDDVSAEELKRCQEVGIEFATATIRHVLTELQREDQKQGFYENVDEVTLHSGEYIYSALYLFAKGYRNIAIRMAPAVDSRIICVLKNTDMASFMHFQGTFLLGGARLTTAQQFPMMKSPVSVSVNSTYGMACEMLATKRVDCCIVLDSEERFLGRFPAASVCNLWWNWKKQSYNHNSNDSNNNLEISDTDNPPVASLSTMLEKNTHENYAPQRINIISDSTFVASEALYDEATYKIFKVMLSRLDSCGHLGIFCNDFDKSASLEDEEKQKKNSRFHESFESAVGKSFLGTNERPCKTLFCDIANTGNDDDDDDSTIGVGSANMSNSPSNYKTDRKKESCQTLDILMHKMDIKLVKVAKSSTQNRKTLVHHRLLLSQSVASRTSTLGNEDTAACTSSPFSGNARRSVTKKSSIFSDTNDRCRNMSSKLRRKPLMLRSSKGIGTGKPGCNAILQKERTRGSGIKIIDMEKKSNGKKQTLDQQFEENGLISLDDPITAALEVMARHQTSRAFVVQEKGRVLGVITFKDLALYMINEEAESKLLIRKNVEEEDKDYMVVDDI